MAIPADEDIAKIKRVAKVALVYEIKKDGQLDQIVSTFSREGSLVDNVRFPCDIF